MNSEVHENPYEPPKALISVSASAVKGKAPASTKWLFVFISLGLIGFVASCIRIIATESWSFLIELLQKDWMTVLRLILGVTVLVAMLARQKRVAYFGGTLALGLLGLNGYWQLYGTWQLTQRTEELVILVIAIALMSWLFYRFTFGLPSRRYYGIAPVADHERQTPSPGPVT